IGPVWDANEVWLLTAGGATFAAFPEGDATLFSGFYLPLLIILVCLIVRAVAFEYPAKRPEENCQRNREAAIFWTSRFHAFIAGRRGDGGRGIGQHRARSEDRPAFRVRRQRLGPAQPLRAPRRPGDADVVPLPWCGVHGAQDRRGHPGAGAEAGPAGRSRHGRP